MNKIRNDLIDIFKKARQEEIDFKDYTGTEKEFLRKYES